MKRIVLLTLVLLSTSAFTLHKYYVSVSEVNYVKEEQAVQIITRLYTDDFEAILKQRYDDNANLVNSKASPMTMSYIKKYFKKKFIVTINGEEKATNFIGKEFEDDMIVCYIEVPNIESIKSIKIENTLLFDLTEDQQNMMHFDVNGKKKSFILRYGNDKGMLNF